MKLRNKKTGEVFNFVIKVETDPTESHFKLRTGSGGWEDGLVYGSLEELNEEWEDYEEPKETMHITPPLAEDDNGILIEFERHKDAEKAVEKLKAWKRLKDKGFRFILDGETEMPMFVYSGANGEKCITSAEESKQCRDDIKLLFGGEE